MSVTDAPNYRISDTTARTCENCRFGIKGVCALYDFVYAKGYVCDSWREKIYTGIYTGMSVPMETAVRIEQVGDGAIPIEQMHITTAYLGNIVESPIDQNLLVSLLSDFSSRYEPLPARINGFARFTTGEDKDAIVALVDSPALVEMRRAWVAYLAEQGIAVIESHAFTPHITVAYIPNDSNYILPATGGEEHEFLISSALLMYAGQFTAVPLGAQAQQPAEETLPIMSMMTPKEKRTAFQTFLDALGLSNLFKPVIEDEDPIEANAQERAITDVETWDGSASRWPDTDAYCADCLIDVNDAAGRDTKAQSHCFLPVRGPEDRQDNYVRQAIFAAAGGRGITQVQKPADVPQEDWDAAVKDAANEMIMAYEQMGEMAPESVFELAGKEMPMRSNVDRALSMPMIFEQVCEQLEYVTIDLTGMLVVDVEEHYEFWPMDIYVDETGAMFLIAVNDGRLYRGAITVTGDTATLGILSPVSLEFVPTERSKTIVSRGTNGRPLIFQIVSTAVINRVGEIDSTALYDSFVAHIERTGELPAIDHFHLEEKQIVGHALSCFRHGYCYGVVWQFDDTEIGRAAEAGFLRNPDEWGASIQFTPTKPPTLLDVGQGIKIPVYTEGVNRFVSLLPEKFAASYYTAQKSVRRAMKITKDSAIYLSMVALYGSEEEADRIIETMDKTDRAIQASGAIARQAPQTAVPAQSTSAPATPPPAAPEPEVLGLDDPAVMEAIVRAVTADPKISGLLALGAKIEAMSAQIQNLVQRTVDQKSATDQELNELKVAVAELQAEDSEKLDTLLHDLPQRRQYKVVRPRETVLQAPTVPVEKSYGDIANDTLRQLNS